MTREWNRYADGGTFELYLVDLGTATRTRTDVEVDTLAYRPRPYYGHWWGRKSSPDSGNLL